VHLTHLEIDAVRVIGEARLALSPQANLFQGPNGAGKTALLESIHLLAAGRSFRSGGAGPLIQQGAPTLRVRAQLDSGAWLAMERDRGGALRMRRGDDVVRRLSEMAAALPVQLLLPDAAELVFGGPVLRRQALDWGLFHVEQLYRDLSSRYNKALKQRNAALRASQGNNPSNSSAQALATWSDNLADLGEQVHLLRSQYVVRLNKRFAELLLRLSPELSLDLRYSAGFEPGSLAEQFRGGLEREIAMGSSQYGPHRADLRIRTKDRSAGSVLSRGQGKIAATAIRLAQAADLIEERGVTPVFLIDDVGAELDFDHNERLFGYLQSLGCQVLATTALDALPWTNDWAMFHVKQGRVAPASDPPLDAVRPLGD